MSQRIQCLVSSTGSVSGGCITLKDTGEAAGSAFRWLRLAVVEIALVAATWLVSPMLFAQESDNTEFVRPQREFGALPSWKNQMGYDRMPASEILLLVAPIRREGFTPRLQVTEEYTDNVFFAAQNRGTDDITKMAPGLGYQTSGGDG